MALLERIFGRNRSREALEPLYRAIIGHARDPEWYRRGGVPDTKDGRFDMVAALLALTMVRLEREGVRLAKENALLSELFIEDMDAQLREEGVGDVVVGKHVGRMMSALGGRLTAYREGFAESEDAKTALVRNLYRGERPGEAALDYTEVRMRGFFKALGESEAEPILAGHLPPL